MKLKESLYYAKILLFGEYGIIEDSMGLSVPYNNYNGKFRFPENPAERDLNSNKVLRKYLSHLQALYMAGELPFDLDLEAFINDVENGMSFDSSIPQGFGIGSSGALVAAIYGKYAIDKIDSESVDKKGILDLRNIFSLLESYFHGKSSGLDPLICYLNIPILIKSKNDLDTIGLPSFNTSGNGAIFLLNTGLSRETQPLVQLFLEKLKQEGFRKIMKEQFKKYNDDCINAFLKGDFKPLFGNMAKLSRLLLDNFAPMIPGSLMKAWQQGLDTQAYYLKLCGSGGGGFILGFTPDMSKARKLLSGHDLEVIYTF